MNGLGPPPEKAWEKAPLNPSAYVEQSVSGFTELRCHGVSGPSPGTVLRFPEPMVTEVLGNSDSGFWRRWRLGGPSEDKNSEHLEAFCWGGLTSRASVQALWLLLLPFTLINLAHWMVLPYKSGHGPAAKAAVIVLRVLALSYTVTLLLAGAEIGLDVGAWQCAAVRTCRPRVLPLGLASIEGKSPGWHLATGAVALAVILGLLWLAGMSRDRPLQEGETEKIKIPEPAVPACGTPVIGAKGFWADDKSSQWLRGLHATVWCAGLGAILTGVLVASAKPGSRGSSFGIGLLTVNLALAGLVLVLTLFPTKFGRGGVSAPGLALLRTLEIAAVAILAVSVLVVRWLMPGKADLRGTRMPVLQGAIGIVAITQIALLVILAGVCGWLAVAVRRHESFPAGYRPILGGMLPFVIASLGWLMAMTASSGVVLLAARYFGVAVFRPESTKAAGHKLQLLVPPSYPWIEAAAVIAAVAVVAAFIAVALYRRLKQVRSRAQLIRLRGSEPESADQASPEVVKRSRSVALTWLLAQSVEAVPWILAIPVVISIGLGVWAAWRWFAGTGSRPYWFPIHGLISHLPMAGAWLTAAGTSLVIAGVYAALRNQNLRRLIGILWDVTTFWPRANHPLTPPCTAERSVPQLAHRIKQLTAEPGDFVVLSGHSQGAILSAAAVLRIKRQFDVLRQSDPPPASPPENHLSRLALLTYGSPLRRLYSRSFPAYFPLPVLREVKASVGDRWLNLWCWTDPVGGSLGPPPEPGGDQESSLEVDMDSRAARAARAARAVEGDRELESADLEMSPDPLRLHIDPRTGLHWPVCDHSGYLNRPEYLKAVASLRGQGGSGSGGH